MSLDHLLRNNRHWAESKLRENPEFFAQQSKGQSPKVLWLGCSDSRVPPTEILQLGPGDVFVSRNIANVVLPSDLSTMSILQYAVQVLKVEHIVLCGHRKCGGIKAATSDHQYGLIDNWLLNIKNVEAACQPLLDTITDPDQRLDALTELNVFFGIRTLIQTPIVRDAWTNGHKLQIHGWVFDLESGDILDLECTAASIDEAKRLLRIQPQAILQPPQALSRSSVASLTDQPRAIPIAMPANGMHGKQTYQPGHHHRIWRHDHPVHSQSLPNAAVIKNDRPSFLESCFPGFFQTKH